MGQGECCRRVDPRDVAPTIIRSTREKLVALVYTITTMSGLLRRANTKRNSPADVPPSNELLENGDGSIGDEEQREILAEIDQIAAENKIMVTPNTFTLQARRGGATFPLLVNLIGLLVLAGGVFALMTLYQREEAEVRAGGGATVTAESRLIEELRRQTDLRIAEKEEEINSINAQLAAIQSERFDLEASIAVRVRDLEQQLRAQLDEELEAERRRLLSEGIPDEQIERLLRDYERTRIAQLRAQVEEYRNQLELEQRERSEALAVLELDLSRSLDDARRERTAIAEESRRREDDLRTQYETRLAQQSAQALEAQSQLTALRDQRDREVQVQNQITGFYERIRAAIAAGEYADAFAVIEQFRAFLDQESVRSLPMVQQRRSGELFALETLSRLAEPRALEQGADTADLLARAQRLGTITRLIERADEARDEGRPVDAEALYQEALSALPGGLGGHRFLLTRDQERTVAVRSALIASRVQEADEALAVGAVERALVLYEQAIADAVLIPQAAAAIVQQIRDAGVRIAQEELAGQFRRDLAAAERETRSEMEQIMQARIATLQQQANQRATQLQSQITALETQLSQSEQRLAGAQSSRAQAQAEVDRLRTEINALRLAAAQENTTAPGTTAEPPVSPAPAVQTPATEEPVVALDPQLLAELERLRRLERDIAQLRVAYERFKDEEDRIVGSGSDPFALIEGKLLLDAFLRSADVQRLFPQIAQRVTRYDQAVQATGRRGALLDTMEIVYTLSGQRDPDSRRDYLLAERNRTADPELSSFLEELYLLVAN